MAYIPQLSGTVSVVNSTSVSLTSNAVFTGTSEDVSDYADIRVSVFSDQASATDGLQMQQSSNGTNWDISDNYSIPASTGKNFSIGVSAKFFRIVYTNGAVAQSTLRLQVLYHKTYTKSSSVRPQDSRTNDNDMEEQLAYSMGYNGTSWDRLRSDTANGLDVDVTRLPSLPTGTNAIGSVSTVDTTSSGTITASSQSVALALNGKSGVAIQVTGTWVGTLQFEGTIDGTNWVTVNGVVAGNSTPGPTITTNGIIRLTPSGLAQVRITSTAWTSGTASISIRASDGSGGTFLNQSLTAGTNLIGKVGIDQTTPGTTNKVNISTDGQVSTNGTVFTFSTVNSTTTQLAASATFAGAVESILNQQSYSVLFFSDQNATITISQYIDAAGLKLVSSLSFSYTANGVFAKSGAANGNYIKVTAQNTGGSTTTTLQLDTAFGTIPSATQLNNEPTSIQEINGTVVASGNGVTGPGSQRVTIASDNTAFSVNAAATLAAETTKVIGVVRNSDGAGNLLTSNSTTPAAKFSLDQNITSILGTAPTTVGKLDVKAADGDVFVRQATAANLNATVTPITITKGTQSATGFTTQDLKDAGRNQIHFYTVIPVLTSATDTLQSLTGTKSGATVTATTTPAVVTTGKTMRITRLAATYIATATSGYGIVRLRFNTGGVVAITSPIAATLAVGAGTPATANSYGAEEAALDEGWEFAAATGIGISVQGFAAVTATAVGYVLVSVTGYEY